MIEHTTKRKDGDYKTFIFNNAAECAQASSDDDKRQSFIYGVERRDYWLKHFVLNGAHHATVISEVIESRW